MFQDNSKRQFPGASVAEMEKLRGLLSSELGVTSLQIVESVAYSMAMVVRVALGLTADQASVGVIYNDSLAGWISLAAARHLFNAGCKTQLVRCEDTPTPSPILEQLKRPLSYLKMHEATFSVLRARREVKPFLASCHNVLFGISPESSFATDERCQSIVRTLNENSIPVHAIEAPLGVDLDSGVPGEAPLFASSTLSLGVPYSGLAAGTAHTGRHYLADISLPYPLISETLGCQFPALFSEQPVIQIFPVTEEETQ